MQSKKYRFSPLETPCSFMEKPKVNYDKLFIEELEKIKKVVLNPHSFCMFAVAHVLLIHIPCLKTILISLSSTIIQTFFQKVNIIVALMNSKHIWSQSESTFQSSKSYNYNDFVLDLLPYSTQKEGQDRCRLCFEKRLSQAFAFAQENGFDYCGTVMSISRFKNSQILNQIGLDLAKNSSKTKWLTADFKKNGGYEKSLEMVKECKMYFQKYCGCQFSIRPEVKPAK